MLTLLLLAILTIILTGRGAGVAAAVVGAASPINVNLKSRLLSNALGNDDNDDDDDKGGGGDKKGASGKDEKKPKPSSSNGGVSLDLSGRVDCCVLGGGGASGDDSDGLTVENPNHPVAGSRFVTPLFRYDALRRRRQEIGSPPLPSLFVGADYDFRKVWFGATRLVTTLAWSGARNGWEDTGARDNTRRIVGGHARRSRLGANLSFEKGLLRTNDYSTKLEMILRRTRRRISSSTANNPQANVEDKSENEEEDDGTTTTSLNPSSISLRLDTLPSTPSSAADIDVHSATVAGRTSLHPRLDLIARTTIRSHDHRGEGASYLSHRVPPPTGGWSLEEGGWIPEVSVTPGGRLVSKNALGFRGVTYGGGSTGGGGSNGAWYDGMRTGVRLVVSRQLNWNALGLSMGASSYDEEHIEDTSTFVRLELSGLDRTCTTLRCVTLEAALERLRESAKVTLLLERVRTQQ